MNENTPTSAPTPEEKTPISSIISIIVIVAVLALGAFYFFKQVPVNEEAGEIVTPAEMQADTSISNLSTQGTSTDLGSIEADLNATDLTGVDAGLSDIAI